jgi:hypothetical protein
LGDLANTRRENEVDDVDRKALHYEIKHGILYEGWKTPHPKFI